MVFKGISIILLVLHITACGADDGVVFTRQRGSGSEWVEHYCIDFNPGFRDLPSQQTQAVVYPLTDLSPSVGCNETDYQQAGVNNKVVLVARGECNFSLKASLAQAQGAVGLLIASNVLLSPGPSNASVDYIEINITVATILWSDVKAFQAQGNNTEVLIYAPTLTRNFDPNLIVIFTIAVSNIFIGGCLGGLSKHKKYVYQKWKEDKKQKQREKQKAEGTDAEDKSKNDNDNDDDDESVDLSLVVIIIFFILVCAFLVLLYFFYDYLVYVVIGIFCLAGAMGLYSCLLPLWKRVIPLDKRLPANKIPILRDRPEIRSLMLMPLCLGVAIFWGVQRHESYAWVIQDILGFAFCINVMKTVHIPNLKICTVMLLLLFVYDIFFVFITPLLTKSGDSIMVKVATGGDSQTKEQLPMVFQVPRLGREIISVCPRPMSLLGFGDIIIPGLLVAHNYAFDIMVQSRKMYYIASAIAYAIGLIITFVALAFMKTGQPALLYLVPCTLGTTFVIGLKRKEVRKLWNGVYHITTKKDSSEDKVTTNTNSASITDIAGNETNISVNSVNSDSSVGSDNENRTLLRK